MARLILFELKKMLTRRVALVANLGVAVFLVGIMTLNVVQARTTDASGKIVSGTDAIAQTRLEAGAHAGAITSERAAADIAAYQERLFSRIDREAVLEMTGSAVYDLMFQSFSDEEVYELYNPYWSMLLRPWRVSGEEPAQTAARVTPDMAADWYGAVAGLTQDALDDGQAGMWEYSHAERAYWTDKQAGVAEPIEYGYVGGWENIISCAAFLVFAILAVCVTLAPTFSFEYQSGADAVVLATRRGRSALVAAKVVAALAYATAYFALCAAVIVGFSLAFYGADGFGLSVQSIELSSPYPLTAGQAALISVGLMYVACLGFACLTLAVSSRARSTLAVFLTDVVLVLLTGLVPSGGIGVLERALALFPLNFANFSMLFSALDSYPLGPVVLDLIGMVAVAYVLLSLVSMPVAALSFRRHQVV
ncbi:MAG TPA: ABC transporter permease [Candidatus Olsenella pullistercoris]|uniref:ABC transporter permease n=1 Tax=Candidatus Olsenella pullistercoris TaxID=2838712 RepID=A0A9D2EXU1_9ACTN|nr:ABC transporter permease [Candidatus Olsenella pullistercoris]